jgi:hypothetical protein
VKAEAKIWNYCESEKISIKKLIGMDSHRQWQGK